MNQKILTTLLAATVTAALSSGADAADNSVLQQMNPGFTNPAPKNAIAKNAVSPKADQIQAKTVMGDDVKDASGATIAKITDLIIDQRSGAAALAIIEPRGGKSFDHGKSGVAWSGLRFVPGPTGHFVTSLDQQALNAGRTLIEQARTNGSYIDAKNDLLGKEVIGRDGTRLGHLQDLVLTFGTGQIAALIVDTRGGVIALAGERDHAVSWDAAKPKITKNGGPIHIALSKEQVDNAPVTTTLAPAPIPSSAANRGQVVLQRDSTGNISGTKIPAPQDRR